MAKVNCVILDTNQMPMAKATLVDIRGKRAYLSLTKGSYGPQAFEERQTVQLRIINADKEPETYRGKISIFDKQKQLLELAHFEMTGQVEKRMDVKVIVNKPAIIICPNGEGGLRKLTATLRDISAGGVCILTAEDIPEENQFEIVFDLTNAVDVMKLDIIRKDAQEDGTFLYGCAFAGLHSSQEHMVREYVFKRHLGLITHSWRS